MGPNSSKTAAEYNAVEQNATEKLQIAGSNK